jgi:transposase
MKKWGFLKQHSHRATRPEEGIPMSGILPDLRFSVKQRLLKHLRRCRDAALKTRYLIIVNLSSGRSPPQTAAALRVHRSTVYRVAQRFTQRGELGLLDRREDNGAVKLDEAYLANLREVVRSSPKDHGGRRPTWTREMLVETLRRRTGVRLHVATLSRALALIRARRGRPRPTVGCPWPKGAETRRLNALRRLVQTLPRREAAVYEDEVDIHLNPKVGLDWMVRGQQKEVETPGQNEKRYLAGALDVRTGQLTWAEGVKKTSELFVALLAKLYHAYPKAKVIHVILDNYRIHSSRYTEWALGCAGGRIQLHFLPPYCPEGNKIERVWQDLHANVTRNHSCPDMRALMCEVRLWLQRYNRRAEKRRQSQAA